MAGGSVVVVGGQIVCGCRDCFGLCSRGRVRLLLFVEIDPFSHLKDVSCCLGVVYTCLALCVFCILLGASPVVFNVVVVVPFARHFFLRRGTNIDTGVKVRREEECFGCVTETRLEDVGTKYLRGLGVAECEIKKTCASRDSTVKRDRRSLVVMECVESAIRISICQGLWIV
ncbi:hypothetical protein Tco_0627658 [Tanacetum coccineum]|uniref:Transmembrane protein n=1 Tax=Tanacetum coccineum TaxID=301880 RepID=A0ABQ4WN22_9ASTR